MKLFSEYLKESEEQKKKKGTYSSFQLSDDSKEKLHSFLEKNNIGGSLIEVDKYHVTVTYSRKAVPEISKINPELPIKVKAIGWDIFGDGLLVLKLNPSKLVSSYNEAREMGAESDYDEYVPHITVANEYVGEIPKELPKFFITLVEFLVEELDLEFSYDEE